MFTIHRFTGSTLILLVLAAGAGADVIPPGMKSVVFRQSVDLGAFKDRCYLEYVVRAGDTLSSIAGVTLGDSRRWPEIVELNPGIRPDRLAVGSRLLLPPRAREEERYHVFFADVIAPRRLRRPRATSKVVEGVRYGTMVWFVPDERLDAFLREVGDDPEAPGPPSRIEGTYAGPALPVDRLAKSGSPVAERHHEWRVTGLADGSVTLELEETLLDADGRAIDDADGGLGVPLFALGLAIAALGGLLCMTWARRRGGASGPRAA